MIITSPTTVRELIKNLEGFPHEAVIDIRSDETGDRFIFNSVDLVHPELVVINIEENIDDGAEGDEE